MDKVEQLPSAWPPAPAVMAILSRFDRKQLDGFIAVAIDLADAMDGDADLELAGDELNGAASEDEPLFHGEHPQQGFGPGCPISDPDYGGEEPGEWEEGI